MGPEIGGLEEKLAIDTQATRGITVASSTEALQISLISLGVKYGDEVFTTPITFVATAEGIVLLSINPIFVEIEPDNCNKESRPWAC